MSLKRGDKETKENNLGQLFSDMNEDDRKLSADKLTEYIRIGSAGGFILIGALVIAILALLIWGFTGTIQETITDVGIVIEQETDSHSCICFVDVDLDTGVIPEGKAASIRMPDGRTFSGTMHYFSASPQSVDELKETYSADSNSAASSEIFSDWMMDKLLDGCDYAYLMAIETEGDISAYWHQIVQVTVVMDEVRPISFLL